MSLNIFAGLQVYGGSWEIKERKPFSKEEIDMIAEAKIVDSAYGMSVKFSLRGVLHKHVFIPLGKDSLGEIGDVLDMKTVEVLTLSKDGEADINRVHVEDEKSIIG